MILALVHVDSRIPLGLVVDSFPLTGSMIFKVLRFSLVCFFKTNYHPMQVRRIEECSSRGGAFCNTFDLH